MITASAGGTPIQGVIVESHGERYATEGKGPSLLDPVTELAGPPQPIRHAVKMPRRGAECSLKKGWCN